MSSTAFPQTLRPSYGKRDQDFFEKLVVSRRFKSESSQYGFHLNSRETSVGEEIGGGIDYTVPVLPKLIREPRESSHEDAVVVQLWEGTVITVSEESFRASLHPKMGQFDDHAGNISFEWVMEQDLDLVKPGAVFYLTLYKGRRIGGTIINAQELRFRRLPAWTAEQVEKVNVLAAEILAKTKARPIAE